MRAFALTTATLVLILCGASTPVLAQNESLLIGPGDTLHIQVFDTPELEQHPRVTDNGEVPLVFVGSIKVASLTPGDAAQAIAKALRDKKYMLNPQVTVSVEQYATQTVSVLGQVTKPGVYPISTPRNMTDLLALAGGLTGLADRHITIERHGESSQKVTYYLSNNSNEALDKNVLVYPGDTVVVPQVGVVYVLGDVQHSGGFPITTNDSKMSLLQALTLAGAPNHTASSSKSRLIRKTETGATIEMAVSIPAIQSGKQPDLQMRADDVLYVPFSFAKNVALTGSGILAAATSSTIYLAK